ncbi:MAG: hypothetical protein KDM64_15565, partial [Verrucomicrobiae bacterium]|nr:hypothetical protein [Verrucomicrobiae bacterium]
MAELFISAADFEPSNRVVCASMSSNPKAHQENRQASPSQRAEQPTLPTESLLPSAFCFPLSSSSFCLFHDGHEDGDQLVTFIAQRLQFRFR